MHKMNVGWKLALHNIGYCVNASLAPQMHSNSSPTIVTPHPSSTFHSMDWPWYSTLAHIPYSSCTSQGMFGVEECPSISQLADSLATCGMLSFGTIRWPRYMTVKTPNSHYFGWRSSLPVALNLLIRSSRWSISSTKVSSFTRTFSMQHFALIVLAKTMSIILWKKIVAFFCPVNGMN